MQTKKGNQRAQKRGLKEQKEKKSRVEELTDLEGTAAIRAHGAILKQKPS